MVEMTPELQRRFETYYAREAQIAEIGRPVVKALRHSDRISDPAKRELVRSEILQRAQVLGVTEEKLLESFVRASMATLAHGLINSDVAVRIVPAEYMESGMPGIHPAIAKEYARRIHSGQMKAIVAELGGVSVARGNIFNQPLEDEVREELGDTAAWLHGLQVDQYHRNMGIGPRMLMESELEAAYTPGFSGVIGLGVRPDNEPAIGLFKIFGYQQRLVRGRETFTTMPIIDPPVPGDMPRQTILMVKTIQ